MSESQALNQAISAAYDQTPYTSNPIAYTAPGNLRAVAHLHGLDTAPLARARVLELGSAAGGNLLPFAAAHPEATVVGIDLSPVQIEAGRELVEHMGLKNLTLRAMSITDIDASFGQFDYIICHGVFSWVPPEVRDAIWRVCRENLAPQGVACISYNTYPGWKASDVVRDGMLLSTFGATTAEEKLERARAMLNLLDQGLSASNPMQSALKAAVAQLRRQSDYYLMHEYLEAINSPCYFLEFVAAAQQNGLAYVADAQPHGSIAGNYGANVAALHKDLSGQTSREMQEQYLDFSVGRTFRKSLVVHESRASEILERPEGTNFKQMVFGAVLLPVSRPADAPAQQRHFLSSSGTGIATDDRTLIAVIEAMNAAWPRALGYAELGQAVLAASEVKDDAAAVTATDVDELLIPALIRLFNFGVLNYRLEDPGYANGDGAAPRLIPGLLAMLDAGQKQRLQTGMYNLWHQLVHDNWDGVARHTAGLLDGSRSPAALRTALRDALRSGKLNLPDGKSVAGSRNLDGMAQELLVSAMASLRRAGLLVP